MQWESAETELLTPNEGFSSDFEINCVIIRKYNHIHMIT